MPSAATPSLFALMARLTAEARQKLGERRRSLKAREGVEERLIQDGEGKWKLEYRLHGTRLETLDL